MPVKMEFSIEPISLASMGMEWEDSSVQILDFPTLEYTSIENDAACLNMFEPPSSPMNQIISHDCMWSGTCGDKSHPGKLAKVVTQPIQQNGSTPVSSCGGSENNSCNGHNTDSSTSNSTTNNSGTVTNNSCGSNIKNNSSTSNGKIQISSSNSNHQPNGMQTIKMVAGKAMPQIAAGQSLLLSRNKQINGSNQIINNNVKTMTNRMTTLVADGTKSGTATRPDTPLSLDDDSLVFKHQINLVETIAGSGGHRRREDSNSQTIINMLREHLEEDLPAQRTDQLYDIISSTFGAVTDPEENVLDLIPCLSDYENDNEITSDADSDSEESSYSASGSSYHHHHQQIQQPATYDYQETSFGDHSYTRPKDRFDTRDLGVQTPSDSEEEEIDVVSVGRNILPTNPSARDRRALQTTVAHKISARMVKTQKNGLRTIPPRRRCSNGEDLSSCTSSSSSTPTKHFISASTNGGYYANPHQTASSTVLNGNSNNGSISRKRPYANGHNNNSHHSSSKKHRGKKTKSHNRRNISDSDDADSQEKRNLHNDMERQRRIGLKNLFEELKATIPSIRDKERAPKVNILREATNLCLKLTRDAEQHQALVRQNARLQDKLKKLRAACAPHYNTKRYVE